MNEEEMQLKDDNIPFKYANNKQGLVDRTTAMLPVPGKRCRSTRPDSN
jgi:hypothetical protein